MKHCGREVCQGTACENWEKCRGETIPPWSCGREKPQTATVCTRDQDIKAAADALYEAVLNWREYRESSVFDDEGWAVVNMAMMSYLKAKGAI